MTQRSIVILSFALFVTAILWGGYALIIYLGIPVHQLVYSTQDDMTNWDLSCGSDTSYGTYFCRGAAVLIPFLITTLQMASPFYAYAIVSLLVAAALVLYASVQTGHFLYRSQWRPLTLIGLFCASVWLFGATFATGSLYNLRTPDSQKLVDPDGTKHLQPFNRFFEPTPSVYSGVGQQAMDELQANYQYLLSHGCLADTGVSTQSGARIFRLRFWCIQQSFFARVGTQFLLVAFLLINFLAIGRLVLQKLLGFKGGEPVLQTLVYSLGIGALVWVAALWTLGIVGLLQTSIILPLFFGLPLVLFHQTKWWFARAVHERFDVEISWNSWYTLLVWLLVSYLALNFLNVVRPFPIGWDDLGSYLNRPRLLASYGAFIPSMSQFQWEYLTSLGFLIFGYDSWVASAFAMEINWMAGLIAVLSVYAFGRRFFGRGHGVLAAMLYYFLPMTGHFSFADMKIDNASFFTTTLAVLAVLSYYFPSAEEDEGVHERDRKLLLLSGLLLGFSFAIKPTAVLGGLMIVSMISGASLGPWGFAGGAFLGFGILQKFGALNVAAVSTRAALSFSLSANLFVIVMTVVALGCFAMALRKKRALLKPFLSSLGIFVLGGMVAVLPWMGRNLATADYFSVSTALNAQDKTAPQVLYVQEEDVAALKLAPTVPVRYLPPELKLDESSPFCQGSARTEELDRYWGFDKGFSHYLTLAWRQVMNLDAYGYYVTLMPAILLFPLLLLLPYFWSRQGRWLRLLFAGTCIFFVQWSLVANGIPWYGIGMFLGFVVALEAFVARTPDAPNKWLFGFLITMSVIICFTNRLWQFDTQKNLFEYPLGKITAEALREVTIPEYDDIRESVISRGVSMPETPYTYRIGTFISYFIPRNREIFPLADHQMQFFNCINQEQDHVLTLKRLHALGFNGIIFDTNTQTIEKDPNGSLHQKVQRFLDFVNDPAVNVDIAINSPGNGVAYILLPTGSGAAVQ